METPTPQSIILTNLKLLGFKTDEGNTLRFGNDMFSRPNEKGLYHVLYFLLSFLFRKQPNTLKYYWPVTTTSKNKFKREVQNILSNLEYEGHIPTGCSQASRINAASGTRTIEMIWHLSTYVLQQQIKQRFPKYNLVQPPQNNKISRDKIIRITKEKICLRSTRINEECIRIARIQDEWKDIVKELSNEFYELEKLQELANAEVEDLQQSYRSEIQSSDEAVDREIKLKGLSKIWNELTAVVASEGFNQAEQVVDASSKSTVSDQRIDARDLKRSCRDDVTADVASSIDSLASMTQGMTFPTNLVRSDEFSEIEELQKLASQQYNNAQDISREISEYLQTLEKQNDQFFRTTLSSTDIRPFHDITDPETQQYETFNRDDTEYHLIPPTPASKFEFQNEKLENVSCNSITSPVKQPTLEDIASLAESVRKIAWSKPQSYPKESQLSPVSRRSTRSSCEKPSHKSTKSSSRGSMKVKQRRKTPSSPLTKRLSFEKCI